MNSDGFVALTKCYFCLKDDKLLLNTRPDKFNKHVAEAHGCVVDMDPCVECKKHMQDGIILISIDPEKSEPGWNKERIPNPYRTGGWWVIKEHAVKRMFNDHGGALAFALEHRWMFIDHKAAEQTGLFSIPAEKE